MSRSVRAMPSADGSARGRWQCSGPMAVLAFFSSVVCSAMSSHDTFFSLPMRHTRRLYDTS